MQFIKKEARFLNLCLKWEERNRLLESLDLHGSLV